MALTEDLNLWFRGYVPKSNVKVLVIREHKPQGRVGVIVPGDSADPGLSLSVQVVPVDEDHSSLSHLKSRESDVYRLIADFIRSPLDGPHPDTLHADRMQGLEDAVRDMRGGVDENTAEIREGLRDVEQALGSIIVESPVVTREAARRLAQLKHARLVPGFDAEGASRNLLREVEEGELAPASTSVRQSILAWCARVLATKDFEAAQAALERAEENGTTDETVIARAFLQAYGPSKDKSAALSAIGTLRSPASFTASLMIVAHEEEPSYTIGWLKNTGLTIDRFDADGKLRIIGLHLNVNDWPAALGVVESLSTSDFVDCPALLSVAAAVYVGQTVHADLRSELDLPLPQDLLGFPLSDDAGAIALRSKAIELDKRAATAFAELNVEPAVALASDRALWLELRDPASKDNAIKALQYSMAEERVRLRRIPLALAFGLDLNLQAVEQDIERATALSGGTSVEAAVARFAVALHRKTRDVPDYIEKHREQLIRCYEPMYVDSIAVEGLAKSGRIDEARTKLAALAKPDIDQTIIPRLQSIIDEAASGDGVARRESEYKAAPTVPALINLVSELKHSRDFPKLAQYAGDLFKKLKDGSNAEVYVGALYEIGENERIVALAEEHPAIVAGSEAIKSTVSWAHYRLGQLREATALLTELSAGRSVENDRYLSQNIAIASGDWSSLGTFIEDEWTNRDRREPKELLRAGILAQRIGSARSQELVREAAKKAGGDAQILAMCYETAASSGWENDEEIHNWLATAIENSGEEGPIQKMDIRELLDRQPSWNEQVDRTWNLLIRGEAPMFAAGQVANRTLLDLFLRPALQNLKETDARKRSLIFAFAGTKPIQSLAGKRLAIDFTSLLTFALTGLLRRIVDWCDSITISHTTLGWLFEERSKLAFHQPSVVRRAREVKRLIDDNQLHRFEGDAPLPDIEHEVGEDIARYLVAAQTLDNEDTSQKIVVRPFPLPKIGTLLEEQADISGYENHFAGCTDVLDALKRRGHLTDAEQVSALAYLKLHEQPWPHSPTVQEQATLYLDDLAVSYFQHLKLLPRLAQAGFEVFVTSSEAERAAELMRFDESGAEARQLVEELQIVLRDGIASGKVKLGRLLPGEDSDERFNAHPTRMMVADRLDVDAFVIDDRFVNKHSTMGTSAVVTSIDVLTTLAEAGLVTPSDFALAMTKLRLAGMIFVPHKTGEIETLLNAASLAEGRLQETAELRAIRESINRARMTDALQLPEEGAWMDSLIRELLSALRAQWNETVPNDLARARSMWILHLLDIRGWAHRGAATGITAADRYRAQIMSMLLMPAATKAVRQRYWSWLEDAVLNHLKHEDPESYQEILSSIHDIVDQKSALALERVELGGR